MLTITMPRGDIQLVRFLVYDPDGETSKLSFTEVYFSVKRNAYERDVLFQKTLIGGGITELGPGDYQIKIMPEDTENLDFGDYEFDIQVRYEDQIKHTECGILTLTKEITCVWNEVS